MKILMRVCFFLSIAILFIPAVVLAQDPTCNPDDPACPIDSGVIFLIVTVLGIAIKKYYDTRKKQILLSTS